MSGFSSEAEGEGFEPSTDGRARSGFRDETSRRSRCARVLVRDSIALGRVDYYVVRPAGSPDELFHEAVSTFLLEWASDQRRVPHTVHIVGEAWSGRAYELREVFERCAAPHAFCLADSQAGRELLAKAGSDAKLPP